MHDRALDDALKTQCGLRVYILGAGHLSPPQPAQAWTREAIGLAMAGAPATLTPAVEVAA